MWVGKGRQWQSFCSKGAGKEGEKVRVWGRERGRDPDPHPAGLHCLLFQEILQCVLALTYHFNFMDVWNAVGPQHLTRKYKASISALFAEGGWNYSEFWSHEIKKGLKWRMVQKRRQKQRMCECVQVYSPDHGLRREEVQMFWSQCQRRLFPLCSSRAAPSNSAEPSGFLLK